MFTRNSFFRSALPAGIAAAFSVGAMLSASSMTRADDGAKTGKKATTAAPTICAVMGKEIKDPAKAFGKTEYNGKTYYFCCGGCDKEFAANPAHFAKLTELRTEKMTLEQKLEAVNAKLKAVEAEGSKKAEAAPQVAAVYCAITNEAIASVEAAAGKTEYNGKTYYFCCPACIGKFNADPAKNAAAADARAAKRAN